MLERESSDKETTFLCTESSTRAWRELGAFWGGLHWSENVDGEYGNELIIWDTIEIEESEEAFFRTLIGVVYKYDANFDELRFDELATRQVARELSTAYERGSYAGDRISFSRSYSADLLSRIANGSCPLDAVLWQ